MSNKKICPFSVTGDKRFEECIEDNCMAWRDGYCMYIAQKANDKPHGDTKSGAPVFDPAELDKRLEGLYYAIDEISENIIGLAEKNNDAMKHIKECRERYDELSHVIEGQEQLTIDDIEQKITMAKGQIIKLCDKKYSQKRKR